MARESIALRIGAEGRAKIKARAVEAGVPESTMMRRMLSWADDHMPLPSEADAAATDLCFCGGWPVKRTEHDGPRN